MTKEKIKDAVYTRRYIYNFHYHLIWVTKYRHQTFSTKELVDEMKDILRMVAKDNEIVIEKMEVMPDHVHVLISFPKQQDANQRYLSTKVHSSFSNNIQKLDNHNIGVVIYGFPTTICVRSAI